MPLLDVSEVFYDADFTDTIDIIRTTQTIDSHGRAANTEKLTAGVTAIVTAGTGQTLAQLNDGSRISDSMTIHCQERLMAAAPGNAIADVVLWQGNRYVVKVSSDWSRYGAGFYSAACEFVGINP